MSNPANAGLVPVAISSPVPLNPIPQPAQPAKSNANIVIVILLIALFVFCIFLFTKLNTQNKQIKELQNERESNAKAFQLLQAIAQRVGVRQNDKGEIELLEEDQNGENVESQECEPDDEKCNDEKMIFIQSGPSATPLFARMFAQQRDFMTKATGATAPATDAEVVVEETTPTTTTTQAPAETSLSKHEESKDGLDKVN